MTPKSTSYIQTKIEIDQPLQEKGMSIQKLVATHMNEGKNIAELSFERQHESLPSILKVIIEKEDLNYDENIILRNNEEIKKLKIVDDDAQDLNDLVVMGDEPKFSGIT